jgi:superfamily II DNA or RNA helicase
MNNDFKQKLQEREFLALKDEHRVILKWATGCGKSKMTIDLINYQCMNMLVHIKPVRVLFVVAERAHIMNWQDEFEKWNLRTDRVRTDVICYASLKNYKNEQYDIIVFDEAHHAFSEKRLAILEEMALFNYAINNIYLLSATLSSGKQDMIEGIFGKFKTSTVTLKDAIEEDILPDPKVYVIGMELDELMAL